MCVSEACKIPLRVYVQPFVNEETCSPTVDFGLWEHDWIHGCMRLRPVVKIPGPKEGWEELWPVDNLPTGRRAVLYSHAGRHTSSEAPDETDVANRASTHLSLWHFWNIFFLASYQLSRVDNWGSSDPSADICASFCFHGALDRCSSRRAATAHRWLLVTWCTKNANTIPLFKTQYKNKKFKILC